MTAAPPLAQLLEHEADLLLKGREPREALSLYEHALSLGADPHKRLLQRWTCRMLLGEYEQAWRESDIHRQAGAQRHWHYGDPLWDGRMLEGRPVLIRCQHGLGDTIQFLRYVPLLQELCPKVAIEAQPPLIELLSYSLPEARLYRAFAEDPLPGLREEWGEVAQLECMELPYIFRTSRATIPPPLDVTVTDDRLAAAVKHVNKHSRPGDLRVGLNWCSSAWQAERSVPLEFLQPVLAKKGAVFFSLQPEGPKLKVPVVHDASRLRNIADTAALIQALDLVITPDTMVAHLAGSTATPVWTLLMLNSDWRWGAGDLTTLWYPSMRLYRQSRQGDWQNVISDLIAELPREIRSRRAYLA